MNILSFLTRKPSPPSPSEAGHTLSMRTQRSRDAREQHQLAIETAKQIRAQVEARKPNVKWRYNLGR